MVWIVDTVVVACSNFCNFRYHYHGELDDILKIQRAKSLQNSWEKLKKSNCLVTAELQKKKRMPHFDHFPINGEIDPYMLAALKKSDFRLWSKESAQHGQLDTRLRLISPGIIHFSCAGNEDLLHLNKWDSKLWQNSESLDRKYLFKTWEMHRSSTSWNMRRSSITALQELSDQVEIL